MPGPACYAKGGKQATVTDAYAVLGYLPPALLGGSFKVIHFSDQSITRVLNANMIAFSRAYSLILTLRAIRYGRLQTRWDCP